MTDKQIEIIDTAIETIDYYNGVPTSEAKNAIATACTLLKEVIALDEFNNKNQQHENI